MTNCDIQIWHTLAKVELFVFLFVIKLFLNSTSSQPTIQRPNLSCRQTRQQITIFIHKERIAK